MNFKYFTFLSIIIFLFSCSSEQNIEDVDENPVICSNTDIKVSEQDNVVINHATNPVLWQGNYTNTEIKLFFTKTAGDDDETETFNFVFTKENECLKPKRGYKYYNGKLVDISAITEMEILEFYISNWELNSLISGVVVYKDPHDKNTYSRKIWVDLVEDTSNNSNQEFLLFENCFDEKMPIDIDMNNDNVIDYKLSYQENRDIGNSPNYTQYIFKLISTNDSENEILSPKKAESPYFVVFEPPFNSENTRQYFNGVKNELDIFYEFDAPYESYNYFLNNNLTYKTILNNNREDYYLIRMSYDGKSFYGWIKFKFDPLNCDVSVLQTYLSPNDNEHIYIN